MSVSVRRQRDEQGAALLAHDPRPEIREQACGLASRIMSPGLSSEPEGKYKGGMVYALVPRTHARVGAATDLRGVAKRSRPKRPNQQTAETSLPPRLQARMERSFAFDFSSVRVLSGGDAPVLGARAYARGGRLHFSPGEYAPESAQGQALIGHELAHIVQQSEGRVPATTRIGDVRVNEDAALEREAHDWGARASRGQSVRRGAPAISRPSGGDTPAQLYKDYSPAEMVANGAKWRYGKALRVADDGTAAVRQESIGGSKGLYIPEERLAEINAGLSAAHVPVVLTLTHERVPVVPPMDSTSTARELTLVAAGDRTAADPKPGDLEVPSDCGVAAGTMTGAVDEHKHLRARYSVGWGGSAVVRSDDPDMMKYEVMLDYFSKEIPGAKELRVEAEDVIKRTNDPDMIGAHETWKQLFTEWETAEAERKALLAQAVTRNQEALRKIRELPPGEGREAEVGKIEAERARDVASLKSRYDAAAALQAEALAKLAKFNETRVNGERMVDRLKTFQDAIIRRQALEADIMGPYIRQKDDVKDAFDRWVDINRYANPKVGEAYVISSGGAPKVLGRSTWNFHWGAVIFKSVSGSDNVTLENYQGSATTDWKFQMYGIPARDNPRERQTFHEQHRDVHQQHGTEPTTLRTTKI